ncbi:MAG: hypothetical protein QOD94_722 [Alphaproteobacteria bacterium]|nr:hypothetical protein [Alphaproteobacteria bacterium]
MRTNGAASTIADVVLDNAQADSRYLGDITVSPAAAVLPTLDRIPRSSRHFAKLERRTQTRFVSA